LSLTLFLQFTIDGILDHQPVLSNEGSFLLKETTGIALIFKILLSSLS